MWRSIIAKILTRMVPCALCATIVSAHPGSGIVVDQSCVAKITLDGKVEAVLQAERPWSPTGVAVHGEEVYVLEYTNPHSDDHQKWRPRVRKLGREGKVTTLATISQERNASPRK